MISTSRLHEAVLIFCNNNHCAKEFKFSINTADCTKLSGHIVARDVAVGAGLTDWQ